MLILGMVSAGIAYNHQLSLTHAAREAGRYAATLPVTNFASMDEWLGEVIDQTITDATGSLDDGVPGQYVCVAYVSPGSISSDSTKSRVRDANGLAAAVLGQPCFADGRPASERRVQIEVRRDTNFNVLLFSRTLTLDSSAVNRFEAGLGF